ncbi:Hsp70 family protein [Embleya scabrispora]|uniref:Hsp70 family protein n=1 Tax=Embleya scabrispora TaxID=159449 RepID=UPI0039C8B1CC
MQRWQRPAPADQAARLPPTRRGGPRRGSGSCPRGSGRLGNAPGAPHPQERRTRARFEQLTESLIERCPAVLRKVCSEADVDPKQLDQIVLTGGSTRIPASRPPLGPTRARIRTRSQPRRIHGRADRGPPGH